MFADRATSETDRALELRTRDRQRKLISKIDDALRRIEDGSYGFCEETGEPIFVGTVAREVYDVTGAGDTVIATLAAALAAGATLVEAAMLANHAAGIVVGKVGTATADAEELINSFDDA